MAVEVVVSIRAKAQIEHISDYISRENPSAAVKLVQGILDRCEELALLPLIGRRRGERHRVLGYGGYLIFYRPEPPNAPKRVIIVSVVHGARNVDRLFPR